MTDHALTLNPGDKLTVTVPATPAPPAPPTGLFIAPNGSDTAAGTLAAPMKTILAASAKLVAGQTLWCRGGTYTGQGGYNWKKSGTATAPVTIKAYPGEVPLFSGAGVSHGIIVSGYNYVVIDGLHFNGYGMGSSGDGTILLLNAKGITVQNCRITNSGIGFQQDHHIYVNSGCSDLIIRNNVMDKTPGAGVHCYHDPGPVNLLIEGNTMTAGYWGVIVDHGDNVRIIGNTFSGNTINIDARRVTNITASGNTPNDVIT